MDIRPNQTLYVNNLTDKLNKLVLRNALYYLFSQYGRLIDMVVMKTMKMRGQAFIIFSDVTAASNALKILQGFQLFGKPMRIQYARADSTQITQSKTTALSAEALRKREEEREKRKKKKLAQKMQQVAAPAPTPNVPAAAPPEEGAEQETPHNILYVSNLPEETTDAMLTMLFNQFSGFREARKAPGAAAFIEYENDSQAASAKSAYEGFRLTPTHAIAIKYAKK